jgi:hypothetical protein
VSPVQVRAGTPGSRSQRVLESARAGAGRHEPHRREHPRGPHHHVQPAASSDGHRERRAAHLTATARSAAIASGWVGELLGGWGPARAHGSVGNRSDPAAPPRSGHGRSSTPMATSSVAQRESAGVVGPSMGVQPNAPGGQGPRVGQAGAPGPGAGMVRTAGPHHPTAGIAPSENVRRLEGTRGVAAERPSRHRGHRLVHRRRGDALWASWRFGVSPSGMPYAKTIGTPDAGTSQLRFERGSVETGRIAVPRH